MLIAARVGVLIPPFTTPSHPTARSMRQALEDRDIALADYKGRVAEMQKTQEAEAAPLAARCASLAKAIGDIHAVLHSDETAPSHCDLGSQAVGGAEEGGGGGSGLEG